MRSLEPTRTRFHSKYVTPIAGFFGVMLLASTGNMVPRDHWWVDVAILPMIAFVWFSFLFVVFHGLVGTHRAITATRRISNQATIASSNFVRSHGWPSWRDAWGVKGMRPGGWIVACWRGVVRVWMYGSVLLLIPSVLFLSPFPS